MARNHLPVSAETVARTVVDEAVARYFVKRRLAVPGFVDRHFSLKGALALHARAAGADLWRAPLNAALVAPALGLRAAGWAADRLGRPQAAQWLRSRELFVETDVAREVKWLIHAELLEIPYRDGERVRLHDALAAEILSDPRLAAILEPINGSWGAATRGRMRAKLELALGEYVTSRAAAVELANVAMALGVGGLLLHQVTPGVLSLGPALAQFVATHVSASALPMGTLLVDVLHTVLPAAPSLPLVVGATGGVLVASAAAAAFSGVVTDPVQRALGLHQRRLVAMLDTLERNFRGDERAAFVVRDHYIARVLDLLDIIAGVARTVR